MVTNTENGTTYFVKPLEVEEPFEDFLNYVKDQEQGAVTTGAVKYAQTRMWIASKRAENFALILTD